MRQLPLPFFSRTVFVDWHGVLSKDPFWLSIIGKSLHPLRPQLQWGLDKLFSRQSKMHAWMKGMISSEDIISDMAIRTGRRYRNDFLSRTLLLDCAQMRVDMEVLEVLRKIKPLSLVVLATDNTDSFARSFHQIHRRRARAKSEPEGLVLAQCAHIFDDILCSSDVGQLKAEDTAAFFGPVLSNYKLRFSDALLIDDRADNCESFQKQGGSAIQWQLGTNDIREMAELVACWLRATHLPSESYEGSPDRCAETYMWRSGFPPCPYQRDEMNLGKALVQRSVM